MQSATMARTMSRSSSDHRAHALKLILSATLGTTALKALPALANVSWPVKLQKNWLRMNWRVKTNSVKSTDITKFLKGTEKSQATFVMVVLI
jgi:hypothetical protein